MPGRSQIISSLEGAEEGFMCKRAAALTISFCDQTDQYLLLSMTSRLRPDGERARECALRAGPAKITLSDVQDVVARNSEVLEV